MKHTHLILMFFMCSIVTLHSQVLSLKYGNVTNDELNMTVYSKDTAAAAVVLYEDGETSYDYRNETGFWLTTTYKKKFKILKQEGIEKATISIPYYYTSNSNSEHIEGLEVTAYNLENGKIIKTKLDKKYLFDEEMNSYYKRIKFSVPNVKVGTVIEYKLKRVINSGFSIPDWEIQTDIPVISSIYEVNIPEYFKFKIDIKGFETIARTETDENQQFNIGVSSTGGNNSLTCTTKRITYTAKDVPALKDEDYVWCVNDFTSGVRFELGGTNFPNDFYRPYSQTWTDIENTLTNKTDFVSNSKISNPYKDEIKALVNNTMDNRQKAEIIYGFVKNRIRWNEIYSFYGENPKDAAKKGIGNNAQINFILMSALADEGIKSYPILISRRSNGRLPYTFPSMDKLNTFIVAAETTDSTVSYMDGSAIYGGLNVLPSDLLVDRGYIFDPNHSEKWINLTNITKNEQRSFLLANLDNDGNLKGTLSTTFTNKKAYAYKSSITDAKDSTNYVDRLQNSNQITVDSLFITGKEPMSNIVNEKLLFTKKIDNSGEFLYINPLIFSHIGTNDFTQTERKLPIEFEYPYIYIVGCNLTIPENYEIVEMPKSQRMALNENSGNCLYQIGQNGNNIQMKYRFEMKQSIFPTTDYPSLSEFYGQIATKNTEMIVLKKKQS